MDMRSGAHQRSDPLCQNDIQNISVISKRISKTLKKNVNNVVEVVKSCRWAYPVVIKTLPCRAVNGVTLPFPNLFWLVCPQLNEYVSDLEDRGWIDRFEEMMMDDPELMKKVEEAHVKTIDMRYAVARKYCLEYFASVLGKRGIGGIADRSRLKCLHLHVANYLGGIPNPIGKMVFNMIGEDWECRPGKPKCRV